MVKKQKINLTKRDIIEIKRSLKNFITREYREKRPINIKLIQVKRRPKFMKGSKIPSNLQNTLKLASYIVVVDYGKEFRFYFFDLIGQPMGGSTVRKSENVLDQMKGLGKTLYQLPKLDPKRKLDMETIEVRNHYDTLKKRLESKFNQNIPSYIPISVMKYDQDIKKLQENPRFGIEEEKNGNTPILHIPIEYYNSPLLNHILLRELFFQIVGDKLSSKIASIEPLQIIANFWALFENQFYEIQDFIKATKKISFKLPLSKKLFEWFMNLTNSIQDSDKKTFLKKKLNILVKSALKILIDMDISKIDEGITSNNSLETYLSTLSSFIQVFSIWIMKYGLKMHRSFFIFKEIRLELHWVQYHLMNTIYSERKICDLYKIPIKQIYLSSSYFFLFHTSSNILQINASSKKNTSNLYEINFNSIDNNQIPEHEQKYLQNLIQIFKIKKYHEEFKKYIKAPSNALNNNLSILLSSLLANQALKIEVEKKDNLIKEEPFLLLCKIENKSDFTLKDVEFIFNIHPKNRLDVRIHEDFMIKSIENKKEIGFVLNGNSIGNCGLEILLEFDSFKNIEKRERIIIYSEKMTITK